MSAGLYNITIEQRAKFSRSFTYQTSAGVPISLVGCTVTASIKRKISDQVPLVSFTCTITGAAAGQFSISLTAAQTAKLPVQINNNGSKEMLPCYYDIFVSVLDERIIEGTAFIDPAVT